MLELESNQYIQTVAYQIQKEGNVCNGDSFYMKATEEYFICAVADGLGSGLHAHDSSNAIREVVEQSHYEKVDRLIDDCNNVLKNKRGAVVSLFKADFLQRKITYSSVGNIRFVVYSPPGHFFNPVPVYGYLSGKPQKYGMETFSYEKDAKFLIHTDGLHIPAIKHLLASSQSIKEISNHLEMYTETRKDDLTYIIGQLY
ncbi:SpoIIE family protein phosphatase [Neobacillus drentensis]|uniref:SpoIIE family protein phosphatase n=1 Tax=Neobacillus drentensis TaxID=220684 RepID=UPI002FFF757F